MRFRPTFNIGVSSGLGNTQLAVIAKSLHASTEPNGGAGSMLRRHFCLGSKGERSHLYPYHRPGGEFASLTYLLRYAQSGRAGFLSLWGMVWLWNLMGWRSPPLGDAEFSGNQRVGGIRLSGEVVDPEKLRGGGIVVHTHRSRFPRHPPPSHRPTPHAHPSAPTHTRSHWSLRSLAHSLSWAPPLSPSERLPTRMRGFPPRSA